MLFRYSEMESVFQRETHFHKFSEFIWVLHFFSSLSPHASVCIRCLVLGMTDVKFLISWLQGVDFHCIFC